MSDTSTIPGSGTEAPMSAPTRMVAVQPALLTPVATNASFSITGMFPTRMSKPEDSVIVQLDSNLLMEQSRIERANESIRRRSRG